MQAEFPTHACTLLSSVLNRFFAGAVALPPAERAGLLDRECAGDAELRARVEGLLRASVAVGGFLETAALPGVTESAAGTMIGRYKLLE